MSLRRFWLNPKILTEPTLTLALVLEKFPRKESVKRLFFFFFYNYIYNILSSRNYFLTVQFDSKVVVKWLGFEYSLSKLYM